MGRTLLVASLLAGSASLASAQAPGDDYQEGTGAPGMMAPQPNVVETACDCITNVMANRWAVGLSIGGTGLAPDSAPDAQANFNVGELALRFRATPHFELELAVGGGRQDLGDGYEGDTMIRTVALSARYRFMIHSHWNWWLMGGLGAATFGTENASNEELDANQRPLFQAGVGVEHRWSQFALQAELKGIGLGEPKGLSSNGDVKPVDGSIGRTGSGDTVSGGSFTLGVGYYF
ncbi:MAG: outer membrane beta-barrel protein [Kofleriaceae bacterium]